MLSSLHDQLKNLPESPGVYQFFSNTRELLYVGKAKSLKKRVSSYWQKKHVSPWTSIMIKEVAEIKVTEVASELEALMLENSYVKSLRPKYNIQLRDDKTFPFIRVSGDSFPLFTITRRVKQDRARYLGPYFSATYLRSMLKLLQELYGIKTASDTSYESRSSVPKEIGLGVRNLDNRDAYRQNVEKAIKFISAPQPQMERIIKLAMIESSEQEKFERAAILRDRLLALVQLRESQSLFSPTGINRDIIGVASSGKLISIYILFERDGQIINHKQFLFESQSAMNDEELIRVTIEYLYVRGLTIPEELVVLVLPLDNHELLQDLTVQTGRKIKITVPQRGEIKKRLTTAIENAKYQLSLERAKKSRRESGLTELMQLFQLHAFPHRIEACDISNLGASHIVGATIVFIDGKAAKNEYRKYRIETPSGQDDFASMRELVFRRLANKKRPLPDLLLIDGGKGQLSAAIDAMNTADIIVPCVALAKKEETLYLPGQSEPIVLPHSSDALLVLTALRDEVHRFVIGYHRQRRGRKLLAS